MQYTYEKHDYSCLWRYGCAVCCAGRTAEQTINRLSFAQLCCLPGEVPLVAMQHPVYLSFYSWLTDMLPATTTLPALALDFVDARNCSSANLTRWSFAQLQLLARIRAVFTHAASSAPVVVVLVACLCNQLSRSIWQIQVTMVPCMLSTVREEPKRLCFGHLRL
jgi:hypothetical protein